MSKESAALSLSSFHNVFQWVGDQPESFIDRLYGMKSDAFAMDDTMNDTCVDIVIEAVYACRAIFQSFSSLAKTYTMRLIFLDSIHVNDMAAWSNDQSAHAAILNELQRFRIILSEDNSVEGVSVPKFFTINQHFRKHFFQSLTIPSEPWSDIRDRPSTTKVSDEEIDRIAMDKWNNILRYLLNLSIPESSMPSKSITEFMRKHMAIITEQRSLTSKGYEFMLKDYRSQIWELIWRIVEQLPSHEDSISLLFMLSYCQNNRPYPVKTLSKVQKQLIVACHEIGIIYIDKSSPSTFYPSHAAINLIFKSESHHKASSQSLVPDLEEFDHGVLSESLEPVSLTKLNELRIIVETNMQVVAYACNDLHVGLLKLFIEVFVQMPNMIMGRITRDKAKEAFAVGITVAQMIDFLSSHCHDVVNKASERGRLPVPDNVIDQLVLWQAEGERINDREAEVIVFDPSQVTSTMFHELVAYLKRLDAILWMDEASMQIVVTPAGYESLQRVTVSSDFMQLS
jgi:hypothetical protein